jgi:class 3 adenylate cyclase/tetratricopeptide (TPR) repeat protein
MAMRIACYRCGAEHVQPVRFCGQCGTSQEIACEGCGSVNPSSYKFCGQCGHKLALPDQRAARPVEISEPVAVYQPEPRNAPERRQISILFCDLVGSTGISRGLDPEELRDLITEYRNIVGGAVSALGGNVARYIGDGVLAFFGYPLAHENDSVRAVRAGLDIVKQMEAGGADLRRRYGHEMQVRIGVHTGVVVVGDLESGSIFERMSVMGEAPNVAARLQEMAQPNRVVVGPLTARLIGNVIPLSPLGALKIKGLPDAIDAFEASPQLVSEGLLKPVEPSFGKLQGRQAERATLWNLWQKAARGDGQIALIGGEAGIGKSRLLRDFKARLKSIPHRWYDLMGSPLEQGTSFGPVIGSIRRDIAAMGARTPEDMARKARRIISAAIQNNPELPELIAEFMGLPWADTSLIEDWSQARKRRRMVEGLTTFVMAQSRDEPIVIAVEDLHWMDASTRELLDALAAQSAGAPVLLLVTHRPHAELGWQDLHNVTALRLAPLPAVAVEAMIRDISNRTRLGRDVISAISERSDGLPLFIEELTRAVIERDTARGQDSTVGILPATLRDSLMERIDRQPEAKYLLQTASVIGRTFDFATARELCGLGLEETEEQLQRLVQAGILFQKGFGEEASYSFRHSLLRDAAYDSMLQRHRRGVHERLAQHYRDTPEFGGQQPEIVAHHFAKAEVMEQAVIWSIKAADFAQARMALREAAAHANTALDLCSRLKERRAEHELAALTLLGTVYQSLKGYASDDAEKAYKRALQIGEALQDDERLYQALWGMASFHQARGPLAISESLAKRLLATAERVGDDLRIGEALRRLGVIAFASGAIQEARRSYDDAREALERGGHQRSVLFGTRPYVLLIGYIAWLESAAGNWAQSRDLLDQAEALALEIGDPLATIQLLGMEAMIAHVMGEPQRALAAAEECASLSRQQLFSYWENWGETLAGWAQSALKMQGGGDRVQKALASYQAAGAMQMSFYGACLLAQSRLNEGRYQEAREIVEQPHEQEMQFSYFAPDWLRLKGEVALRLADRDALPFLREAARVAQAQGSAVMELKALQALMQGTSAAETREFSQRRISILTQRMTRVGARHDQEADRLA